MKQIVIEFNDGPRKMWVAVYEQYSLVFRVRENEEPNDAVERHRMNYAIKSIRPANDTEAIQWCIEHPRFEVNGFRIIE